MIRSFSADLLEEATKLYDGFRREGFDFKAWVGNTNHLMFLDEDTGNIAFLTHEYPGVYTGHYFFKVGGRKGITFAKEVLKEAFTVYDAKLIRGLTRTDNKKAKIMNGWLGFKSYGTVDTTTGEHELFCLTREEFE